MAGKTEKKSIEAAPTKNQEILFKCKFCGETKPLSELIIMRQYYPPLSSCKSCSVKNKIEE